MNAWLRIFEAYGLAWLIAALWLLISVYVVANQNGAATGNYSATMNTNLAGENGLETALLVVGAPAAFVALGHHAWTLVRPLYEGWRKRRAERLSREQEQGQP